PPPTREASHATLVRAPVFVGPTLGLSAKAIALGPVRGNPCQVGRGAKIRLTFDSQTPTTHTRARVTCLRSGGRYIVDRWQAPRCASCERPVPSIRRAIL